MYAPNQFVLAICVKNIRVWGFIDSTEPSSSEKWYVSTSLLQPTAHVHLISILPSFDFIKKIVKFTHNHAFIFH